MLVEVSQLSATLETVWQGYLKFEFASVEISPLSVLGCLLLVSPAEENSYWQIRGFLTQILQLF